MALRTTVLVVLTALLTAAGPAMGMGEPGVAALQVALRAKGLYDGTVDGVCGPGTESYIAAFAGPFIGLGCGYLLVSSLRVKDVGIRHAAEATTAVRNIAPMLLMMIYPFAADPLVTVSMTILNTIGITIVLLFVLMWRRAASPSDTQATTNQPASEGLPPPTST